MSIRLWRLDVILTFTQNSLFLYSILLHLNPLSPTSAWPCKTEFLLTLAVNMISSWQFQILQTNITQIVWLTARRMANEILGVKGFISLWQRWDVFWFIYIIYILFSSPLSEVVNFYFLPFKFDTILSQQVIGRLYYLLLFMKCSPPSPSPFYCTLNYCCSSAQSSVHTHINPFPFLICKLCGLTF